MTTILSRRRGLTGSALAIGLLTLVGCAGATVEEAPAADSLDQLVILDPDFDFSTSRTVRLALRNTDDVTPRAVEVADSEGRRLMDGAFRSSATIDLKVPVGRDGNLRLRLGRGETAEVRDVQIDAERRASTRL